MGAWQTWALIRQTATGELGQVRTLMTDLREEMMPLERDHGIVTSQTVTETGRDGTMIVTKEEEIDTGIDTMIGIAGIAMTTDGTTIEEVSTLVEEVAVPSAVASAATMTTVGVAGTVTGTEIVTVVIVKTDMRDGTTGVRTELLSKDPS